MHTTQPTFVDAEPRPQGLIGHRTLTFDQQGGGGVRVTHNTSKEREGFIEVDTVTKLIGLTCQRTPVKRPYTVVMVCATARTIEGAMEHVGEHDAYLTTRRWP